MNIPLKRRLQDASAGILKPGDTDRRIHEDSLTDLLRREERIDALDGFLSFTKDFLKEATIEPSAMRPLLKKIEIIERDLKRLKPQGHIGC